MPALTREQIAARIARELQDGMFVNLGIGIPTLVANYVPKGMNVILQSENGLLGIGPFPTEAEVDADLINAGSKGKAGTACGAMFLKAFVSDGTPWTHLDIAGPAWTSTDRPETPKGASGFGVRTLLYYLYGWR